MSRTGPRTVLALCVLLPLTLLLIVFLPLVHAAEQLQANEMTTLEVAIHSSPIAVRDNNESDDGPRVLVVHAVMTNTGTVAASDLVITLDYQESPGWLLAGGEEPDRTPDSLAPGESYHAYWFASYPADLDLSHPYSVTALAANAAANTATATTTTRGFLETGNTGQLALSSDIVVGVAFTMVVNYNLGQGSQGAIFGPAGNLDFDANRLRLQGVSVRFHNESNSQELVVPDQLYFPTIPLLPSNVAPPEAEVTYTFLALQPGSNRLCPYLGVQYQGLKYDNNYCGPFSTAVLTGTIGFSFTKQVNTATVQQGEWLTYTLRYSNTGTLPMIHTWIWDFLDPQTGALVPGTVSPAPDPAESSDSLLAWSLEWVDPASSHTFTYAIQVGGEDSTDLEDGQILTNTAFFGINEGSLPNAGAISETVTTTVMAPRLAVSKTDGLQTTTGNEPLTYTIVVRNDGSISGEELSATDLLPPGLVAGTASPPASSQTGQLLTWETLPDLAPGEELTITVPATVSSDTPSFTTLLNSFTLTYSNPAGHQYQPLVANDTTTVLRPAAFVEGTVFEDTNANGVLDEAEDGLAGVELSLPGAFTPTVTTDANGFYQFRVESAGVHLVTENDPSGYTSTTPNQVAVDVALGQTYTVDFGDIPAGGESGTIYGTVFDDLDGNGSRDGGEPGLAGVTLTLDDGDVTTTDAYGRYTFGLVAPGYHTVEETDPDGYLSTTPNRVTLAVVAGQDYQVDFGDKLADGETATIYGAVFDDLNGDGVWGLDEPGIAGVTVALDGVETTTDTYGRYSFGTVTPGLHVVEEDDLSGYTSTTPNWVVVEATGGQSYEVNFGDQLAGGDTGTIFGTVFSDDDGDGNWDLDEVGIPGVTITLDGDVQTTTDSYGSYSFGAVTPALHAVEESDLPGYISTTPNVVAVNVLPGQTAIVNFGDMPTGAGTATVYGTVFSDDDGDGVWDAGEPGIPGVTIKLDDDRTTVTNSFGRYTFLNVAAGIHAVEESDPDGYSSTTPNRVAVNAVDGAMHEANFGDMPDSGELATIFGTVFSDEDGDAVWDLDEPGLAGVTVSLDGLETTTDGYGSYSFGAVAPGLHVVEETDPDGTVSTTPNQIAVQAVGGESYEVNFGDMPDGGELATIFGTVFADDDGDGIWDGDEVGVPGVPVALDGTNMTTDAYGSYSFGAVAPGLHTVVETDLDGYISTTPNYVPVNAVAGESSQVDFGDRATDGELATIFGAVFADANGNGDWEQGEPGIAGVTVTLDGERDTTTNGLGYYGFLGVSAGSHTVEETDPDGYTSTTPNRIAVQAVDGQSYEVNFGDAPPCQPDEWEDDDAAAAAKPLAAGTPASHDFCGADHADWHAVTVQAGHVYTFTTDAFGQRADTILTLYAPDGHTVLAANDDRAGTDNLSSQIVWNAPVSGTYLLRITNRGGLTEWFTGYKVWVEREETNRLYLPLVVQMASGSIALNRDTRGKLPAGPAAPTGEIDHCAPDEYEVDDTWEQAGWIDSSVAQLHTLDSDPAQFAPDKDFVVFEVGPGGSFTASVDAAFGMLLELYDSQGRSLNRSGEDVLSWLGAPMGRYILGVTAITPAYSCDGNVSYELAADYTPLYRLALPLITKE